MLFLCKVAFVLFIIWEVWGIVHYLSYTATIADELKNIRKIIQKKFDSENT